MRPRDLGGYVLFGVSSGRVRGEPHRSGSSADAGLHQRAAAIGLVAGQGHKVILVESVERLPEALVRDAFSDLLRLAVQDRSVIILAADADDADARELEVSCERAMRPALGTQAADLVVAFGLHAAREAAGQDRGLRDAD